MNLVTANRLQNLRKENNLSQEALAEKLGISRQAVSKWERAEASPDTDNLIALAHLYKISLDELLNVEGAGTEEKTAPKGPDEKDYVRISPKGIHVKDENSEVHVGWDGVHVDDKRKNEKRRHSRKGALLSFPFVLLVVIAYLLLGALYDAWHPAWLLFFLIPLWYSAIEAVRARDANRFAYPVLVTGVFLLLGFYEDAWNPAWVLFLTIPVYYGLVNFVQAIKKKE